MRALLAVALAAPLAFAEEEAPTRTERELVEDDYQVKLSLPTEEDFELWAAPGFRLQLGYAHGGVQGPAPSFPFTTNGAMLRPSVRIDRHWSIAASFSYAVASGHVEGLHFAATFEPTFHPLRALGISVGVGYGGLLGNNNLNQEEQEQASRELGFGVGTELGSRTLVDNEKLYGCQGAGLVGLVRLEYLFVVGPLFATGPFAQGDVHRVVCEQSGPEDRETGEQYALRQWWMQGGWSLGWWVAWR